VETGPATQLFNDPRHPYTELLLSSVPRMLHAAPKSEGVGTADPLAVVDGEPEADESPFSAHAIEGEQGCRFRPRCPVSMGVCRDEPGLLLVDGPVVRSAACWHVRDGEGVRRS
jgi:oligopeptide/dipeptide ABC transporter ATP-binding protein